MKLVVMNYYIGMHLDVKEMLDKLGLCTYTRVPEVEGRISCGEPREDSHVWPGSNSAMFVWVDDPQAEELLSAIESFNEKVHGEGVDAYLVEVSRRVMAKKPEKKSVDHSS